MNSQIAAVPQSFARPLLLLLNFTVIALVYALSNTMVAADAAQTAVNVSLNAILLTSILVMISGMGWFVWLTRRLD